MKTLRENIKSVYSFNLEIHNLNVLELLITRVSCDLFYIKAA